MMTSPPMTSSGDWLTDSGRVPQVRGRVSLLRVMAGAVLLLVAIRPAFAEVRILASPGGEVGQYLRLFEAIRQSGERIVIDGPCFSACTLVLSTIPSDRICVTRRAVLGFHAARGIDRYGKEYNASEATRLVAATYPAAVRAWIGRPGGLRSRPIYLRGRDLAGLYRRCS